MEETQEEKGLWLGKNRFIIIFASVFIILVIIIVIAFFAIRMINQKKAVSEELALNGEGVTLVSTGTDLGLPLGEEKGELNGNGDGQAEEWEAETVGFGDFYQERLDDFFPQIDEFILPLNVKIEVANYHDVSRKINLDQAISDLNDNGFAVIGNPFSTEADNFYGMYNLLSSKQVPTLITSDFLLYYYQNVLKIAFKDIESTVFYENLWETNKKLYKIAKERYERKLAEEGIVNDVFLEGARKELAFFAVALSLLSPTEDQIGEEVTLSKEEGFSLAEANEFFLELPVYLKNDVLAEVELIRTGEEAVKSPVSLFLRDYKDFSVPDEYQANARLYNFYLASSWLNSVFPLYFKSEACPNCLLDRDDWRVSMCTALLLAEDLSLNQNLQNKWAKIYKIMSFFQGLRGDLNYLHYSQAFSEIFGKEKRVEEIFSANEEEMDVNLIKLQEKLVSFDLLEIEGALSKESTTTRPFLGMKMLVSAYWPNNYIFNQLTSPKTGLFTGSQEEIKSKINNTGCLVRREFLRCFGFGFDIINLIYNIDKEWSLYFSQNTNYENYENEIDKLRKQLQNFTVHTWHSNNYWTTLHMAKRFLETSDNLRHVFMRNEAFAKKDLETALGSWVNLQLPADIFIPSSENSFVGLNQAGGENQFANFAYIEPNLVLTRELVANTGMVAEMLTLLKINEQENTVLADLADLKSNLEKVEAIIKKELSSQELSEEDYKFINSFIKEFEVKEKGGRALSFSSPHSKKELIESIEDVRLLILTYKKEGKNIFVVGPIFNYWESKK